MGIPRINLAETPDFDLGGLRVSPAHRQVSMNGACRELEPKVAQVLIALASASPAVISRDRLVDQCWEGRVVGDDALNRCILALRHLAREFTPEPFAIETVPRVGYSLLARPNVSVPGRSRRFYATKISAALLMAILLISVTAVSWIKFGRAEAGPASIAVLPFRNLSSGDPYFAEGVSEEISGQLSRQPAFRVAGRASAAQFRGEFDPRTVGRALGVDYVLEGSVRSDADRVRIDASLVKTSDGMRLWSETYDRKLDDILQIQSAIGRAVASGLRRRLVHSATEPVPPVNGQAYALYLNARGLVKSGNPTSGEDAIGLLKQAIQLDPRLAPAWASLAEALQLDGRTRGDEGLIAVLPQARAAADRALRLDPNLPDAHGALAQLVGLDTHEGIAHELRAAELDPRSADGFLRLAAAQHASGRFAQALASVRRAHEVDPASPAPARSIIDIASGLGDRRAAEAEVRSAFPDDPLAQNFGLARVASLFGDYSEAARRWSVVARSESRWAAPSRLSLQDALFNLKLSKEPPSRPPLPTIGNNRFVTRVQMATAPSAAEWQRRNRSLAATLVYTDDNIVAAKLMLAAGRAPELVATFNGPTGLMGIRRGETVGTCYLQQAALVAVALRSVGQSGEADAVLHQADIALKAAYSRGVVPTWLDDDAAAIWALQGKNDLAISALDRALRRGWVHAGRTDLPDIADEPALRSLRGNPRFAALRVKYAAHYTRERMETARALHLQT